MNYCFVKDKYNLYKRIKSINKNDELVSYDVLSNEKIQEALEERRRMIR